MMGMVSFFKDSILRHLRCTPKKSTRFCILDITEEKGVLWLTMHRYPKWMGLKLHIVLEGLMHRLPEYALQSRVNDVMRGWMCNYSMREIVWFLKRRGTYK